MNELRQKMLDRIKTGEVAMRPRWYFVLKTVALLSGTLLLLLSAMYLISFIAFSLKRTGLLLAPGFGWQGIATFVSFSPWLLFGLVGIFFVSMEILVRRYSFGYRNPLLYSALGIVLVSFIGAVAILQIPVHEALEHGKLPFVAPIYERYAGYRPDGMYIGRLTAIEGTTMVFTPHEGDNFTVMVNDRTKLPRDGELEVGELFMVFGRVEDDVINAFGIRPLEIEIPLLHENKPPHRQRPPIDNPAATSSGLFGPMSF